MDAILKSAISMPKHIGDIERIATILDEDDCTIAIFSGTGVIQSVLEDDAEVSIDMPIVSARVRRQSALYSSMVGSRMFSLVIDSEKRGRRAFLNCEVGDFIETRTNGYFIGEVFAAHVTSALIPSIHRLDITSYV